MDKELVSKENANAIKVGLEKIAIKNSFFTVHVIPIISVHVIQDGLVNTVIPQVVLEIALEEMESA